jgi:electron transfer flavoprotein alpha subunit
MLCRSAIGSFAVRLDRCAGSHQLSAATAGSWGADRLVLTRGAEAEEDIASGVTHWTRAEQPWAILAGSTAWGREIASRVAAAVGAGLTGDAVDLEVGDGRLVAWKPAFGGLLLAAITATSPVQMATVRAGVLPRPRPRTRIADVASIIAEPRSRLVVRLRRQEDSLERLGEADVVIGVGAGVAPDELHRLEVLRQLLGAEIGCTRKVTDHGWMPHSSQIGITGRSISPRPTSPSAQAASSTTWWECDRRAWCWRSTPINTPLCGNTPMWASSPTGATASTCWKRSSAG